MIPDRAARARATLATATAEMRRAHRAVDDAQANNRDSMRKQVRVPWSEFFAALRALYAAIDALP